MSPKILYNNELCQNGRAFQHIVRWSNVVMYPPLLPTSDVKKIPVYLLEIGCNMVILHVIFDGYILHDKMQVMKNDLSCL